MKRPHVTIVAVPGWKGAGPDHWMSHWERDDARIARVEQADWDQPDPADWIETLERSIARARGPVLLIAHSCGASTVVLWAARSRTRIAGIAGALLVAPPDTEHGAEPEEVRRFGAVPRSVLPFGTVVVASRNDHHCAFSRARQFAGWWGAELVDAGQAGHLNSASGHGPWPEGRALLEALGRRISL